MSPEYRSFLTEQGEWMRDDIVSALTMAHHGADINEQATRLIEALVNRLDAKSGGKRYTKGKREVRAFCKGLKSRN